MARPRKTRMWEEEVRKSGSTVPFGYEVSPHDPKLLLPIPKQLEALEEAIKYLKDCTSHEVARWVTHTTGRSISHTGLLKSIKRFKKNRVLERAIAKAEAEESQNKI